MQLVLPQSIVAMLLPQYPVVVSISVCCCCDIGAVGERERVVKIQQSSVVQKWAASSGVKAEMSLW